MKVIDWLNDIIDNGLLCKEYTRRVRLSKNKKDLFNLVCDANGSSFLPEMREKGFGLDYEVMKEEFGNFLNGRCKVEYETSSGRYTSALYCGVREDFRIETTLACLCDCQCSVFVLPYSVVTINVDQNSEVSVFVPETSTCYIDDWGKVHLHADEKNIRYRDMRKLKNE